jgi:hypothetical protein
MLNLRQERKLGNTGTGGTYPAYGLAQPAFRNNFFPASANNGKFSHFDFG